MKTGPMILTGFQALNKLLGKAADAQSTTRQAQIMVRQRRDSFRALMTVEGAARRPMYFCHGMCSACGGTPSRRVDGDGVSAPA